MQVSGFQGHPVKQSVFTHAQGCQITRINFATVISAVKKTKKTKGKHKAKQ